MKIKITRLTTHHRHYTNAEICDAVRAYKPAGLRFYIAPQKGALLVSPCEGRDDIAIADITPSLPTVAELASLVRALKPAIGDEFRAYDDGDDDTPSMALTVGADISGRYGWQTGDNSFTGGAYAFPFWAATTITRRSNSRDLARDIRSQLEEAIYA